MKLIRKKIASGIYYGKLLNAPSPPDLTLFFDGEAHSLSDIHIEANQDGCHDVEIDLPTSIFNEGFNLIMIKSNEEADPLDIIHYYIGELQDDLLHYRVAQLEDEVMILKRALRRLSK